MLIQLPEFLANADPATLELVKIITIALGWTGCLLLMAWRSEKRRLAREA